MKTIAALMIAVALMAAVPQGAMAQQVSKTDAKTVKAVFKAIDRNRFKDALRLTRRVKNPDLVRVLVWSYLTAANTPAKFSDIKAFLDQYDNWPGRTAMRKRAEETMPAKMSAAAVLAWFERQGGPVSTMGRVRKAQAQDKLGLKEVARKNLRAVWIDGNFTKSQEKRFYRRYRKRITAADNAARLERLIWQERYWPARRQLWKVTPKIRKLAVARLWLMKREGNVDKAIADLRKNAPELADHPGLIYERMRWRRRKGRTDGALELLKSIDGDPERPDKGWPEKWWPEKWWKERIILARALLQDNQPQKAYDITSRHSLSQQQAADYADAEWVSGWIALRFLDDPSRALAHFQNILKVVRYPISISRGAYWSARAAAKLGQSRRTLDMLKRAAAYPTTYYGQLARALLEQSPSLSQDFSALPTGGSLPQPSAAEIKRFQDHPLRHAASLLSKIGLQNRIRALVLGLADSSDTPGWKRLAADFAVRHGRPDLAIKIAKKAERSGIALGPLGYPQLDPPRPKNGATVETPLVLAVIRQESAFYSGAKSSAGARGLMQVMPATAKRVARANRIPYSRNKLLKDPRYNLIIGQVYLATMVEQFKGSYAMALAAYNAGPQRVKRWVRQFGDPRSDGVDAIDWVEMIPYKETRNYVQRVLENLSIYRAQSKTQKVAQNAHIPGLKTR